VVIVQYIQGEREMHGQTYKKVNRNHKARTKRSIIWM